MSFIIYRKIVLMRRSTLTLFRIKSIKMWDLHLMLMIILNTEVVSFNSKIIFNKVMWKWAAIMIEIIVMAYFQHKSKLCLKGLMDLPMEIQWKIKEIKLWKMWEQVARLYSEQVELILAPVIRSFIPGFNLKYKNEHHSLTWIINQN